MQITRFGELDYQAGEAINTLCANLSFLGGDYKKILITSCHPQEGKSFISMNLMRAFAALGLRVVLVDADIRASALRSTYGINVQTNGDKKYLGLSGYLVGRCGIGDILGKTSIPGAYMILAGVNVTKSLPLFNSPRMGELLEALSGSFDIVLVDTPPVGTLIDAAQIATLCSGTLFVVRSGHTGSGELAQAIEQIEKTGCPVIGHVLNRAQERVHSKKYYYYSDSRGKSNPRDLMRRRQKPKQTESGK